MLGVIASYLDFAIAENRKRFSEVKAKNERGFVLVFCSITLLVLTALGGFAVDVGNWYWNASKMQNAADAAALAGATYLPGDLDDAKAVAESALRQNGFKDIIVYDAPVHGGSGDKNHTPVAYLIQDPQYPTRMHVEIARTVDNYFTSLLGYNQQSLVRQANAFYRAPILMGSPGTVLGAEPAALGSAQVTDVNNYNGQYWLNIAGGKSLKSNGDKYTAGVCLTGTDGCGSNNSNDDIANEASRSHQFIVHVPAGLAGDISLQAFDAAFVDVDSDCKGYQVSPLLGVNLADPSMTGLASSFNYPSDLYDPNASVYCTGDAAAHLAYPNSPGPAPALSFNTYDVTGLSDADITKGKKIGVTKTYPTVSVTSTPDLATQLRNDVALRNSFRMWDTFATIPSAGRDMTVSHDYVIEARTPVNSYGNNHFSLRVGVEAGGSWDKNAAKELSLSAKGHLTVFTNTNKGSTFYFAKITNSQAGRTIDLNLFDIGDAPSGSVDVSLIVPHNASGVAPGFGSCQQLGPKTLSVLKNPCAITGATRASYDGRNVTLRFTVPETYRCMDDGKSGCWMGLKFGGSAAISDTTTWEVLDCGKPLRLIQDGQDDPFDTCPSPSGAVGPTTTTTTSTTVKSTTSTTKKPSTTSTTKKPSTTSTTKKPATTTTTARGNTTTTRPPTTTTRPPSTTTTTRPTTTTQKPTTTTTIPIGAT